VFENASGTLRSVAAGLALALCFGWSGAATATAAPDRIAVLPPEVGGASERVAQTVSSRLIDGMKRSKLEVVVAPSTAVGDSCIAPDCEKAVALSASAKYVVRTKVQVRDNVYRVVLEARDSEGRLVATTEDVCEICGLTEVGDLVSDRGAALGQQIQLLTAAPPLVIIDTNPTGAHVWIDGQLVGRTPIEHQVLEGSHDVRVEADGYVPQRRTVTAVSGVREEVQINLALAPVDQSRHPGRGLIIGGAAALVSGVALIAVGAPLIAINDTEVEDECNPDAEGRCERLYDTIGLGAGLTGVGAAALASGVALLAVGLVRRKKAKERWSATASGFVVRF
jgi:hypothetical protein